MPGLIYLPIWVLGLANAFMVTALWTEISSMPTLDFFVEKRFGYKLGFLITSILALISLIVVPLVTIVFILVSFKRFFFNHQKPVRRSYWIILYLFVLSHLIHVLLSILDILFTAGASNIYSYLFMRLSKLLPNKMFEYNRIAFVLPSLMGNTSAFLVCFLIAEWLLAYVHYNTRRGIVKFTLQNCPVFIVVITIFCVYKIFCLRFDQILCDHRRNLPMTGSTAIQFLINLILMYLYLLVSLYSI